MGHKQCKHQDFQPWAKTSNQQRACAQALGFFHFLEIVTGWLVPSAGENIPVEPGWYIPGWKIPLDENRFLQAGNGT
jgi:4-alpha-glucanotransferase